MSTINKSRREFLKLTTLTGGGLVLGFNWFSAEAKAPFIIDGAAAAVADLKFNSYLAIATNGTITILSPNQFHASVAYVCKEVHRLHGTVR